MPMMTASRYNHLVAGCTAETRADGLSKATIRNGRGAKEHDVLRDVDEFVLQRPFVEDRNVPKRNYERGPEGPQNERSAEGNVPSPHPWTPDSRGRPHDGKTP